MKYAEQCSLHISAVEIVDYVNGRHYGYDKKVEMRTVCAVFRGLSRIVDGEERTEHSYNLRNFLAPLIVKRCIESVSDKYEKAFARFEKTDSQCLKIIEKHLSEIIGNKDSFIPTLRSMVSSKPQTEDRISQVLRDIKTTSGVSLGFVVAYALDPFRVTPGFDDSGRRDNVFPIFQFLPNPHHLFAVSRSFVAKISPNNAAGLIPFNLNLYKID